MEGRKEPIVLSWWPLVPLMLVLCAAAAFGEAVPFASVERGGQSGIETARQVVVRTPDEWATLWKEHAPGRPLPRVDFAQSMIVGVFLGFRPTGGHAVEITRIDREDGSIVVRYRERKPAPSDIVIQVITMPYDLVKLNRTTESVRFSPAQ